MGYLSIRRTCLGRLHSGICDNFFLNAGPHHQLVCSGLLSLSVLTHIPYTGAELQGCAVGSTVVAADPGVTLSKMNQQQHYRDDLKLQIPKMQQEKSVCWFWAASVQTLTVKPTASYYSDSYMCRNCLPCTDFPKLVLLSAAVAAGQNTPSVCAAPLASFFGVLCTCYWSCNSVCVCSNCSVHLWLLQGNSLVYSCLYCWE